MTAAVVVGLGGCRGCHGCTDDKDVAVVYTSLDQVDAEPVLHWCERQTGIEVRSVFDTEETKSTGVLNRLLAEADHPQADLFWSGDPVRQYQLIRRGLVEKFKPHSAHDIPPEYGAADGSWTAIAARARILLVNTENVSADSMPHSVKDLVDPRFRGKVAIANPLFGTTTTHVAALFSAWGDEQAKKYFADLKRNDVRVVSSNGEVKRQVVSGEIAFGLTDTEDANEAFREGAKVKLVYPDQDGMGTMLMPTGLVLIHGGPHPGAARRLAECLCQPEIERRLVASGAYLPLRRDIQPAPGFTRPQKIKIMKLDYRRVAATMERIEQWLRDWVGL